MSLVVCTYLWSAAPSGEHAYTPDDVHLLQRMVVRHLTVPHEFAVITDRPELFAADTAIRAIPLIRRTQAPTGHCLERLMTFHPEGRTLIGERIFQMDLDTIPVGNMDAIVNRPEDVVLWRNPARVPWDKPSRPSRPLYNGSFVLHRGGTMPWVWESFDPAHPAARDDQTWYSFLFGPEAPYWDENHGVYRLAREDTPGSGVDGDLPENARLVTFPGSEGKPNDPRVRARCPWIAVHRC